MAEEIPLEPTDVQANPASNGTGPTEVVETAPEPAIITPPAPEPVAEPSKAQQVEPLSPGPAQAPETAPEPPSEPIDEPAPIPEPQPIPEPATAPPVQTSTPPIIQTSFARELLVKAREVIQFRKRKKLEKIMGMLLKQARIANDDVQKLLYVSDATATRYLDQLEKEGRIKKEGAGKYLSYSRM